MEYIQNNYGLNDSSSENSSIDTDTSTNNNLITIKRGVFDYLYYDSCWDNIPNISISEEIPIKVQEAANVTSESITVYKDVLLETIKRLNDTVDFLKSELEEKNLLIKALVFRNANNGDNFDSSLLHTYSESNRTSPSYGEKTAVHTDSDSSPVVDYDAGDTNLPWPKESTLNSTLDLSGRKIKESYSTQIANYRISMQQQFVTERDNNDTSARNCFIDRGLAITTTGTSDIGVSRSSTNIHADGALSDDDKDDGDDNADLQIISSDISFTTLETTIAQDSFETRMQRLAGYEISHDDSSSYSTSMAEIIRPNEDENPISEIVKPWPEGTICILGDSQLNTLDEKRLGRDGRVKVRNHRGAIIEDMFDHVNAVLRRKPSYIILHVGTNNSIKQDYITIVNGLIRLRRYIQTKLESCKVIISSIFMRNDNQRANSTIRRVNTMLREINFQIVNNENINDVHLGKKGLHLNKRGVSRFALNLISHIRCL